MYYLSATFQEISIYFGRYELLLTSGYIAVNDQVIPLLGLAISNITPEEQHTENICIDTSKPIVVHTERLLRQYMKLHSHKPWGFHSLDAFQKRFTPVIPIRYYGHVSQKNKSITIHHFASELLSNFSGNKIITGEMMVDIWLFMIQIPLFIKLSRSINSQPINFKELSMSLNQITEHVHFRFLMNISGHIEEKVEQRSQFIQSIYIQAYAKEISLKIGTGGLLGDLKKTNQALVKEMKKAV